jgi:hypothetical protein
MGSIQNEVITDKIISLHWGDGVGSILHALVWLRSVEASRRLRDSSLILLTLSSDVSGTCYSVLLGRNCSFAKGFGPLAIALHFMLGTHYNWTKSKSYCHLLLVEPIKASNFIVVSALEVFHFKNLRSWKLVTVFDRALADFFVDDNVVNVLLHSLVVRDDLLKLVALVGILVTL